MTTEYVNFGGWPRCLRMSNGTIELVVTTDVGPRIVFAGFAGGRNHFYLAPHDLGKIGGDQWRLIGGHRLWHAPEAAPRTYAPDNDPVEVTIGESSVTFRQRVEASTGIRKSITVSLGPGASARVRHTMANEGPWPIRFAPWALSVMAPGGFLVVPQEAHRPHPEALLPARPLVLWHYTNMADPRWSWGARYVLLRQDPHAAGPQKAGMGNRQGWAAHCADGEVMLHSVPFESDAEYADFGCNFETYTDRNILEVETLGPRREVQPGASVEHTVDWLFAKAHVAPDEADIDAKLLPLAAELRRLAETR